MVTLLSLCATCMLPNPAPPAPLIEAVFLEYARYLWSLGLSRGVRHYCGRAGENGKQLLEQYLTSGYKKHPDPLTFSLAEVTS